jgi:Sensors of blue-light using FAD
MKPLIQLIYNSAATCVFNNQDLENLLRGARETNAKLDVTGMLLFVDGCFFQVLEGEEDVVDRLAEKIRLDRRHSKMSIIIREPITRRVFRDWSMGLMCMSAEEAGSIEGLNDFFADGKMLTQLEAGRARTILKAFGEGRWRVRLNAADIPQPEDSPKQVTALSENPERTRTTTGDYSFAFQPIVDIRYKRVVSHEALVRGRGNEPAFFGAQGIVRAKALGV